MCDLPSDDGFVASVGRFKVRLLRKGQPYGRNKALVWDNREPGVEFYVTEDRRGRPIEEEPWFVSRYYYTTLANEKTLARGLCLEGSEPVWLSVSSDDLRRAMCAVQAEIDKFSSASDVQAWREAWKVGKRSLMEY